MSSNPPPPSAAVRSRSAVPTIHFTVASIASEIDAVLEFHPDEVFAEREIPALRFDSQNGSLRVADLWEDTNYKAFTGVKGRRFFSDTTPLISIAHAAMDVAASTPNSQMVVTVIG